MIKSLKKNDIRTTPFTAAKKWNPQNKLHKDLILWQSGSVSGSLSLTFKEYNDGTVAPYTYISSAIALQQQQDDFLRFREGVNLSGSISPTGSFYYDPVLSEKNVDGTYKTVLYATTKHLFYKESQDPTKIFGLESLDSSNVNRSLPNKISTFNIPQNKFGEKVIPKSVVITHEIQGQTYNVVDDGNSNLVVSDKTFINNQDANIDKVPANIILNGLPTNPHSEQYDGNPYVITATTKPSGLSYIVTYNGSTTPPTNAGTYTVVGTIDDNFYAASTTSTFIIEKAPRVINITNLSPTYDGNPKSVTVSIPSVNVNYTVTYNGSTTPPTNVGTYAVVVTINDINNENFPEKDSNGQPNPGSGRDTLKILPQTPTITAQCPSKTYGDADFTIQVNTVSNGSISYTINSGPAKIVNDKIRITGVGNLNVTITQAASGNYSVASVICSSITISQKPLIVTGITANDKVQDATTNATLNTANATLQGIIINPINPINGQLDDVTLIGTAVGAFSDSSPGEGKTVTISGLTLSGADNSKYTVVQPTTTAAIKATSANGTITMTSATVTYNDSPQSLGVTIDPNIPIKITYTSGNNVITLVKLYKDIPTISGQYPKDIGIYNVTAELDADIKTTIQYTVSTVTATLNIKSQISSVEFGPNIFYYDLQQKQLQILSKTPSDLNLTYPGNLFPVDVGTYDVLVSSNSNFAYNQTVQLKINAIPPPNSCGTNITNETFNQQEQKNIINLTSALGTVNFSYNVNKGASQFTVEYPLNSGNIVYDSKLRSTQYTVNSPLNDRVKNTTVVVERKGYPENNLPIKVIDKNLTGTDSNRGYDYDKCLVTVYSPLFDNDWYYSVSCANQNPKIPDLKNFTFELEETVPANSAWIINNNYFSPVDLLNKIGSLYPKLVTYSYQSDPDNKITAFEATTIENILYNNRGVGTSQTGLKQSFILTDSLSNIKIIVTSIRNTDGSITLGLKYQRVSDSLSDKIKAAPLVFDCHLYEYTGNKSTYNKGEAKSVLNGQIGSDGFTDTFISTDSTITNGENQKQILLQFVDYLTNNPQYLSNVRFSVTKDPESNGYKFTTETQTMDGSQVVSSDKTDYIGILSDILVYMHPNNQKIMIVYPAICQTVNLYVATSN